MVVRFGGGPHDHLGALPGGSKPGRFAVESLGWTDIINLYQNKCVDPGRVAQGASAQRERCLNGIYFYLNGSSKCENVYY